MCMRRAVVVVAFVAVVGMVGPGMRQALTMDELDLRTIEHTRRIAQLEMELAALRGEVEELRETCCGDVEEEVDAVAPDVHDPAAIPAHADGAYYFRLTAITQLEKDRELLERIKSGFDDRGFSIPFPQRDVHLIQATNASA